MNFYEKEDNIFILKQKEKENNVIKKIEKNNVYMYKRLEQQMEIYKKDELFNPDNSFYSFLELLFKENNLKFTELNREFAFDVIKNNYYFMQYLYNLEKPAILEEKEIFNIYNTTQTGKTTETLIKQNAEKLTKNTIKEIKNYVILKKEYNFILKTLKNKINQNNNQQQRLLKSQNTRNITESRFKAAEELEMYKIWVSTIDKRTRDTHKKLDGQIKKTNEFFEINGSKGQGPGKMDKAEENVNCRCRVILKKYPGDLKEEDRILRLRTDKNITDKYNNFEEYNKLYNI